MRARYYDAVAQQFISRDPLEGVSGQPYVYAGGNPVNATDPTGMWLESAIDIASLVAGVADINENGLNWGNGIGLVADVVSLALPVVGGVGFAVRAVAHADDIGDAGRGLQKLYRYTSTPPEEVLIHGLRPNREGLVFTTPSGNLSPLQAMVDLALPPNRGLPKHLYEIDVPTLRNLGYDIPAPNLITRAFDQPGGRMEVVFHHALPPEVIRVIR
jgi:hypothetical protein